MKVIKQPLIEGITPEQKVEMYHKVYEAVMDTLDQAFDNYAMTLHEKLPEYNPDWSNADGSSKVFANCARHQDSFAIAVTNLLLNGLDKETNTFDESLQEKLIGYKITARKDGQTFDDYMCAYEEEGAIRQMKNKYGDNVEIINVDDSRVIKESVCRKPSPKNRIKWSHK